MLMLALAEVSRKRMPCSRAMVPPFSAETMRRSAMSHLFPTSIFSTSSDACSSMFRSHLAMLSKLFGFYKSLAIVAERKRNKMEGRNRDIVDKHDAHGAPVVGGGDGVEPGKASHIKPSPREHSKIDSTAPGQPCPRSGA